MPGLAQIMVGTLKGQMKWGKLDNAALSNRNCFFPPNVVVINLIYRVFWQSLTHHHCVTFILTGL